MATKKERPAPSKTAKSQPAKPAAKPQMTFGGNAQAEVSPEELRKLISEAAYFRAKQRGFAPGYEHEDWVQAEAEVTSRIIGNRSHRSP
jgi:hypothetical protein